MPPAPPVTIMTSFISIYLLDRFRRSYHLCLRLVKLLSLIGQNRFKICLSVPVVIEYEEVLLAQLEHLHFSEGDVRDFLDYLCSVGRHQAVHYLWRPYLRDAKDDLFLEVAVAGNCDAIITYNLRDFGGADKLVCGF